MQRRAYFNLNGILRLVIEQRGSLDDSQTKAGKSLEGGRSLETVVESLFFPKRN
jgi:hypothetical protein